MSKIIELSDELYQDLERVAREQGLTPAGWIANILPGAAGSIDTRTLPDVLQGLIGAVDSTKEPRNGQAFSPFSELIAKKFEKQGLRRG